MVAPAIQTTTRPADPRTNRQAARTLDPAELLRKIETRIRSLEMIAKRGDDRDGVLAELRAGNSVIVIKGFKWEDEVIPVGTEWHPGYEYIPRLAEIMNAETYKRQLVTKAYHEAGREVSRLHKIIEELAPLVGKASGYRGQAAQARSEQEAARLAEIAAKARAEQAEKNYKSADTELSKYVSALDFEI